MICPQCNTEFTYVCPNCGFTMPETTNTAWIATVTPTFSWIYEIIPSIKSILILIMTAITGNLICTYYKYPQEYVWYATILLILLYIISTVLHWYHNSLMQYHIYENKIVFEDHFIQHRIYELFYENVIDITLNETFLDHIFNTGKIRIYADRSICKGLALYRIDHVETLYQNLKQMIRDAKKS